MDVKMNSILIFFISELVLGDALQCYECVGRDEELCRSPNSLTKKLTCMEDFNTSDVKSSSVMSTINQMSKNSPGILQCFYLYFDLITGPGVYRGCVKYDTNVIGFCKDLNNLMKMGTAKYCHFCASDGCNDREFVSNIQNFVERDTTVSVTDPTTIPTKRPIATIRTFQNKNSSVRTTKSPFIFIINIIIFYNLT